MSIRLSKWSLKNLKRGPLCRVQIARNSLLAPKLVRRKWKVEVGRWIEVGVAFITMSGIFVVERASYPSKVFGKSHSMPPAFEKQWCGLVVPHSCVDESELWWFKRNESSGAIRVLRSINQTREVSDTVAMSSSFKHFPKPKYVFVTIILQSSSYCSPCLGLRTNLRCWH